MVALTCLAADAPLPAPSAPGPEPRREWSDQEKSAVASQIHMYALLMRYVSSKLAFQCGELVGEKEVFALALAKSESWQCHGALECVSSTVVVFDWLLAGRF